MKNLCKIWPLYILLSSGVKSVDKREGSGSHNWGTYEDDIKADQDQVNTSTDETGQTTGMKSTINIKHSISIWLWFHIIKSGGAYFQ